MRRHPADDLPPAARPDGSAPLRRTAPTGPSGTPPAPDPVRAPRGPGRTSDGRAGAAVPGRTPDGPPRSSHGTARPAGTARPDRTARPAGTGRTSGTARPTGTAPPTGTARAAGPTGTARPGEPGDDAGPTGERSPNPRPPGSATPRVRQPRVSGPRVPGRPVRLRLTRRGLVVLGTGAALVVTLLVVAVVGVVRLVAGPAAHADAEPVAPAAVCEPGTVSSLNCWPAITDGADPRLEPSSWITGRVLAGDVHTVLDHVAARFDALVEPVDVDSSWGWAYREVRGDVSLSNHASGTSIDLNATEHPLGETGTFTPAQVEAIRGILAEVAPVVAWGGDFDGRVDEMHFEIAGDAATVAEVAARLRGTSAG